MPRSTSLHNKIDAQESRRGRRRSLAPHRDYATPIDQLCKQLIDIDIDSRLATAFAQGMAQTTRAMAKHFPDNIFADIDFLAAALLDQARQGATARAKPATDPPDHLTDLFSRITELIRIYGRHSTIRFRYAHDFLYGFDWARWVCKSPQTRSAIGPFDMEFLDYLQMRGTQLLALIANGDSKYPPLAPGQWRNPFGFARTPAEEARLHRELAADGLLPVATWDPEVQPDFARDFQQLRRARAERLYG